MTRPASLHDLTLFDLRQVLERIQARQNAIAVVPEAPHERRELLELEAEVLRAELRRREGEPET